MLIYRTKTFRRQTKQLGVTEAEVKALEAEIAANPNTGDVIPGLKGARKIRFAMGGKGKSGGGRAIYFVLVSQVTAYLMVAYAKSEQVDLTQDDRKALIEFIGRLKKGE